MIKKLRIRLVTAAMLSLFVVLAAIIGTAGILSYRNIVKEADQKLQILAENDGRFPENADNGHIQAMRDFSPETPFEMRYFSVTASSDGEVLSVNTGRIYAVDTEQAAEYAAEVLEGSRTSGFLDSYRYLVYTDTDQCTRILFLSCYRELQSFRSFLLTCILMTVIGSGAVLLLLILLSGRIVKPISESYEKQKRFITDAGHELKTPLTIISADTEVLEMDYGESEWINDIRSQTERLADLTNQLVFLARMEEQPKMERLEFSLSAAAEEAADDFQLLAQMKGKNLTSEIASDLLMKGDEKTIRRLLAIFLDNAVKYTNEGGRIRLKLDRWRGQIRLRVYNTADHVDRESLPHLFDRFYRTDSSRNSKTGGYGLGLSIAAAIVAAHNGKIQASTEDEHSLLITVTFPI